MRVEAFAPNSYFGEVTGEDEYGDGDETSRDSNSNGVPHTFAIETESVQVGYLGIHVSVVCK